jgi:FkbM family methyltransferase
MQIKRYWQIIKRQRQPIKFLIGKVLMKLGLSSFFVIKKRGLALRFYPSALSLATIWLDSPCSTVESFFRRYLRSGDMVIDAGANMGFYTLLSSILVGNSGRVYAIEPHPRIFKYLKGNLSLNKCENVSAYNVALGDHGGPANISDKRSDDQNSILKSSGTEIKMLKLDDLPLTNELIALFKIDVEGYEKFVLEGATEILKKVQCVIFESWDEHFSNYDYTTSDIFELLTNHGFHIFKIINNDIRPISKDYTSPSCENLIAVREINKFIERTGFALEGQQN